ncbi:MAG: response regulator, partial [Marichromatium sp.]|nr:response regulator [Marichromatium sp.]
MKETTYPTRTVLCIEDDAGIRRSLTRTLAYYFKRVLEARDGEEGLTQYERHRPDLVICDIQMPKCSGVEVARAIRQHDQSTPIIMLTAFSNEAYLLELINLNIQQFIQKPASIDRLLSGIKSAFLGREWGKFWLGEEMSVDVEKALLLQGETHTSLSRKESQFLALLSTHEIVSYATMESELWEGKPMSEAA